jgi:hypothetical protein
MDTAEIEIAFWWYVGDVGGNPSLLAKLPNDGRGGGVVDSDQNHAGSV